LILAKGQSSKDSFTLLLDKPPQAAATTKNRAAPALDLTRATPSTTATTTSASSPSRLPLYFASEIVPTAQHCITQQTKAGQGADI
jgi:hypothetical protein